MLGAALFGTSAESREFTNHVGMRMVLLQPGEFVMGSHDSAERTAAAYGGKAEWFSDEKPRNRVAITRPFYISKHPVTQEQYEALTGANPSMHRSPGNPVENVSWFDAVEFCRKLSRIENRAYRLPTEAEWEYACRAGSDSAFHFGNESGRLGEYAWFRENSSRPMPVGKKEPNRWGLHDMLGNVWEWCADSYLPYSRRVGLLARLVITPDPVFEEPGARHVLRGGSWESAPYGLRSAARLADSPETKRGVYGFRVVMEYKNEM